MHPVGQPKITKQTKDQESMQYDYSFSELETADLIIDAIYRGGNRGNQGDDPLVKLLKLSNQGGFRYRGDINDRLDFVMILSTFSNPDWPDEVDRENGVLIYYGDNQKPGKELHDTGKRGNRVLRRLFSDAYAGAEGRSRVPPIFAFARVPPGRSVQFLGLVVPGLSDVREGEDLAAVWKSSNGLRFQNYRAKFALIDAAHIERAWLDSLIAGSDDHAAAPTAWREWRDTGIRRRLLAQPSVAWRTPEQQFPSVEGDRKLIDALTAHFENRPHHFERCAVEIARMMLPQITEKVDITRPSRDGGRDAIGTYRIGTGQSAILAEFALEAKCFTPPNSVGVRELSRLISRLRHRQFGVLVTTTWIAKQAYQELIEDGHPIVVISALDIVGLLKKEGLGDLSSLRSWLDDHFPVFDEV